MSEDRKMPEGRKIYLLPWAALEAFMPMTASFLKPFEPSVEGIFFTDSELAARDEAISEHAYDCGVADESLLWAAKHAAELEAAQSRHNCIMQNLIMTHKEELEAIADRAFISGTVEGHDAYVMNRPTLDFKAYQERSGKK